MILSDKTLLRMLEEKTLTVEPLERGQIQPASIDIRLGNTFCVVEDSPTGILELDQGDSLQNDHGGHLHSAAESIRAGDHNGVPPPAGYADSVC